MYNVYKDTHPAAKLKTGNCAVKITLKLVLDKTKIILKLFKYNSHIIKIYLNKDCHTNSYFRNMTSDTFA